MDGTAGEPRYCVCVARSPSYAPSACGAIHSQGDPFRALLYTSLDAFFRGLIATAAGSVAGSSFRFRPLATGRSNDRWRRSAAGLARFFLAVVPLIAGASCERLRFRAAIRSITGGGVITCRGLM